MNEVHKNYGGSWGEECPSIKKPGICLGTTTRPADLDVGDVVTCCDEGSEMYLYFYDPELLIEGGHFLKVRNKGSIWKGVTATYGL